MNIPSGGAAGPAEATLRHANSLSRRLVAATVVFSLVVSVLVSAAQMVHAYRQETQRATSQLDDVQATLVPSLAASLWLVDFARVELLLDGMVQLPGVAFVQLDSAQGERLQRGDPDAPALMHRRFPLVHVEGRRFELGTLDVVLSDRHILGAISREAVAIAVTTTATLASGALLLLLLFRHWVTRHLVTMAEYARRMDFMHLEQPLALKDKPLRQPPDELDEVVLSINRMRQTLREDLALRERYEADLAAHRERLEEVVAMRTEELRQQNEQIQQLANTDFLTGVPSRRHFLELSERELTRSLHNGEPLSLAMMDIDHFKQVNDSHGHPVGDQVLMAVGECIRREMRGMDIAGRIGGEEFAVLLAATGVEDGRQAAERLRSALSTIRVELPDGTSLGVTVSLGVATLDPTRDEGIDALLKRADAALYVAKRGGRDRVRHFQEAPGSGAGTQGSD